MKKTTTNVLVCLSIALTFNVFSTQILFAEDIENTMTTETIEEMSQLPEDKNIIKPEDKEEVTLINGSEITTQVFEEDLYNNTQN